MYQPKYNGMDRYKPVRVGTNGIDRYGSAQITKRNKGIIVSFNYRNGINQYRYDTDNTDSKSYKILFVKKKNVLNT